MDDIFKVILYGAAIVIWIIYKAREQQKSGMWKPRTSQQPVVKTEAPPIKKNAPIKQAGYKTVPVKKVTVVPKPAPPAGKKIKQEDSKFPALTSYETDFLKMPVEVSIFPGSFPGVQENEEEIFIFDLRRAIIGAEILRRPLW